MKEFIEKLIGRLEEEYKLAVEDAERYEKGNSNHFKYYKARGYVTAMEVVIEIVNQLAEEYKDNIEFSQKCVELAEKMNLCDLVAENLRLSKKIMFLEVENNDFCEWNSDYKFISDKYKRETGCGYTFYDLHHAEPFKFCPYCGKKIKVIQ